MFYESVRHVRVTKSGIDVRRFVKSIPDLECSHFFGESGGKVGIDGRLDVDTIGRDTCLPRCSEFAHDST